MYTLVYALPSSPGLVVSSNLSYHYALQVRNATPREEGGQVFLPVRTTTTQQSSFPPTFILMRKNAELTKPGSGRTHHNTLNAEWNAREYTCMHGPASIAALPHTGRA